MPKPVSAGGFEDDEMAVIPPQHEELQMPIAAYVGTPTVPAWWWVDCVDSFESSSSNEGGFVWWCFVIWRTAGSGPWVVAIGTRFKKASNR